MRWDMFKVIVERPRTGRHYAPRHGRADQRARREPEESPLFQPNGRGRGNKHLNENLAPLRRYLLQQVGCPWNTVHAEISAHLRLTSAVQRHVLEHLEQMVVKHVALVDRRPVHAVDGQPVLANRWATVCYVCPVSGLLRAAQRRKRAPPPVPTDRVVLGDGAHLQRLSGVWYHLTMRPVPDLSTDRQGMFDVVLRARLDAPDARVLRRRLELQHGRADVYAAHKQQLGKRALARLLPEGRR